LKRNKTFIKRLGIKKNKNKRKRTETKKSLIKEEKPAI
jgi:hypothetical protein